MTRHITRVVAATAAALVLSGCAVKTADGSDAAVSPPTGERTLTVLAASSLTGLFTDLAAQYEQANPGLHIALSFGSSSTLAQQIAQGAPAQVFASASTKAMTDAGERMSSPEEYLTNRVVVGEPAPAGSQGIVMDSGGAAELNRVNTWIQCAHEAPCGIAADNAIAAFGVTTTPASLEPDAKSVVAKLLAGEADAGVVYFTDALAAGGKLNVFQFGTFGEGSPQDKALTTQYMIGQVDDGNADAVGFIDFVMSTVGVDAATKLGFGEPPG